MPSVVVLDIVGSNRSLGSLAPVACTAARYSNLCALRLPLADIHIRSRLCRSTATRVVPLVCTSRRPALCPLAGVALVRPSKEAADGDDDEQ